ncbi:MAG: PHP domain-containing protein, partial [Gammaproteobacteria bacterium]|nr:PHP domain-containing protein [Gammaproteobacteria bacterium]
MGFQRLPRVALVFARTVRLTLAYAELHCVSNFTFLRGASHPEELVERAAALGYRALALTDECSVAG